MVFLRIPTVRFQQESLSALNRTGCPLSPRILVRFTQELVSALDRILHLNGLKVFYSNTARLFTRLRLSKTDGTYLKELKKLQKTNLLILDDFGLHPLDNHCREALMDIIDDRYNQASTIIVSQIPVSVWYDIIGEGTIADVILDRIVNSSHRIDLKGESMRKGILKNVN